MGKYIAIKLSATRLEHSACAVLGTRGNTDAAPVNIGGVGVALQGRVLGDPVALRGELKGVGVDAHRLDFLVVEAHRPAPLLAREGAARGPPPGSRVDGKGDHVCRLLEQCGPRPAILGNRGRRCS